MHASITKNSDQAANERITRLQQFYFTQLLDIWKQNRIGNREGI